MYLLSSRLKETLFTLSYTSNNMTGFVHHMAAV